MRRDFKIYAVIVVAVIASIASDPGVSDEHRMEIIVGETPTRTRIDLLIERPLTESASSPTTLVVDVSLQMDERDLGSIQSISSTLFTLDIEGNRLANVSAIADADIFERPDETIVDASLRHTHFINDCGARERCPRRFEVEVVLSATEPLVRSGFLGAQALASSGDVTIGATLLE